MSYDYVFILSNLIGDNINISIITKYIFICIKVFVEWFSEQELLYKEFSAVCSPVLTMNWKIFSSYMTAKGVKTENMVDTFR